MFPTDADRIEFTREFGRGYSFVRLAAPDRTFDTLVGIDLRPEATPELTQERAWKDLRRLAHWLLSHPNTFTSTERFTLRISWDDRIPSRLNEIVRLEGSLEYLEKIALTSDLHEFETSQNCAVFVNKWNEGVAFKKKS